MPMPCDEVVEGVSNGFRQQPPEQRHPPDATEVAGHAERRRRSDEHLFGAAWRRLDPDHRIKRHELRMTSAHRCRKHAVQRRELHGATPIVSQHGLHALRAERARPVIQEHLNTRHGRAYMTSLAPGPHPRRDLTLIPRLGFAGPRLGMAAGARQRYLKISHFLLPPHTLQVSRVRRGTPARPAGGSATARPRGRAGCPRNRPRASIPCGRSARETG